MFAEQMLPRARERLATISAGALVKDAAAMMAKPHTDLVVVCDLHGGMIGVLTKTDIVRQVGYCTGGSCMTRVETIMTHDVFSCRSDESLHDIWSAMRERGLQRIPMVDERDKPIGIVYARDVLQNLLGEIGGEEALLRDYVMDVGYQ